MAKKRDKASDDNGAQVSMFDSILDRPVETLLPSAREAADSRYPSLLTVVPLFGANDRENYTTDQKNGQVYEVPGGGIIRRIGEGLDMYDEDTLIAILQLGAKSKLVGAGSGMPVPLDSEKPGEKTVTVYKGELTAMEINAFLGRGEGGRDVQLTRDSIRRLTNQRLWFESVAGDDDSPMEGVTDFFKYKGFSNLRGKLYIQISPDMVNLLSSYVLMDVAIRKDLSDIGKALYRYLLTQPRDVRIDLETLAEGIGFGGIAKELKRNLLGRPAKGKDNGRTNQLEKLIELGVLVSAEITGTGRRKPFTLEAVKVHDGEVRRIEKA